MQPQRGFSPSKNTGDKGMPFINTPSCKLCVAPRYLMT
jgi:hypothetical protein